MRRILFIVLLALPSFCFAQAGADKVRMLVDTLERDSDYKVRIAAAQALSQIADGSVADWMIRAFRKDDNDAVRLTILYAISEIPDERILSPLIELANQEVLSGKERMVIEQTIWNFREIFNTSSWIAAAINSNDIQIKKISIWVLGIIGDKNLIPIFEKLSYSTNEDIQVKSFEALSKMADTSSGSDMQFCRSNPTELVASHAVRAARLCEQMNQSGQ
jgi:HEAT repeat protein